MKFRVGLVALMLLAGSMTVGKAHAQIGDLDPASIRGMDLDATVYNLALARNALGAAMLEHAKRHPGTADASPIAIAPTQSESAHVAALSDNSLESRIEALSAEIADLTAHGKSLQQQGQPISNAMTEVAQKLGANLPVSTAELRSAMAGRGASTPPVSQASGVTGEALCVAGQQVEFVHLNRRWPGTVKGHSYGGNQCLVTSNMNTGSYMQDLQIDFADLRTYAGAPPKGVPDVPGNGPARSPQAAASPSMGSRMAVVTTTPEEVLQLSTRDHDAAIARYDGKRVRVTSLPGRIGISGNTVRLYADPSRYTASVVCLFEPAAMGELRSIPDGAGVTLEGDGKIAGSERINLQNCRVIAIGNRPQQASMPTRPPMGKYICMQSGRGIGDLVLAPSTYAASGKTGGYSFDPTSGRFAFTSGNYASWGWTGVWKTDPQSPGGAPEPRIDITDGAKLNIHCYPPK